MTLQEKSELVRLLNLYQADLLEQNQKNIEGGIIMADSNVNTITLTKEAYDRIKSEEQEDK